MKKGFWEIIESYQLDNDILKICDFNTGYKISYSIMAYLIYLIKMKIFV